jgi:hypothetical protein
MMISKTKYNNREEQQELSDENYQTDHQYEQERFTDEYSEYFEDDENEADRFRNDYHENFTD